MPTSKLALVAPAACCKYLVSRCQCKLTSLGSSCNNIVHRRKPLAINYATETKLQY